MHTKLLAQIRNPVLPPFLGGSTAGDEYQRGGTVIGKLLSSFMGAMFVFAFILALMYLVIGGFSWITSGGDKAKLQEARDKITHAIMGLVIVAAVWAVATLVGQFLGISFPNLPIPSVIQGQ